MPFEVSQPPAPVAEAVHLMPVNNVLLSAVISAVDRAFTMCGMHVRCVGASAVPVRDGGKITGMIGVHGKVSGFITLNMSESIAIRAVDGLLQEQFTELNSQVIDAAGEITNMVVGGIKASLASTPWAFSQITVPSVIVGQGYSIAYSRNLEFLNVIFEHDDKEAVLVEDRLIEDRLIQVGISLLTL